MKRARETKSSDFVRGTTVIVLPVLPWHIKITGKYIYTTTEDKFVECYMSKTINEVVEENISVLKRPNSVYIG